MVARINQIPPALERRKAAGELRENGVCAPHGQDLARADQHSYPYLQEFEPGVCDWRWPIVFSPDGIDETENRRRIRQLEDALEARELALLELNHRVKNNLQIVSSLLAIEARKHADPELQAAFDKVAWRIMELARIHQRLCETGELDRVEAVGHLSDLVKRTTAALSDGSKLRLEVTSRGERIVTVQQAVTLALAVNELVMNSIKHAFAETPRPEIQITIAGEPERLTIDYCDNGCGIGAAVAPSPAGVGRILIESLVRQLGATLEARRPVRGFGVTIEILLPWTD